MSLTTMRKAKKLQGHRALFFMAARRRESKSMEFAGAALTGGLPKGALIYSMSSLA